MDSKNLRYFMFVVNFGSGKIDFTITSNGYPSRQEVLSKVLPHINSFHTGIWASNLCIENVIELSESDFNEWTKV